MASNPLLAGLGIALSGAGAGIKGLHEDNVRKAKERAAEARTRMELYIQNRQLALRERIHTDQMADSAAGRDHAALLQSERLGAAATEGAAERSSREGIHADTMELKIRELNQQDQQFYDSLAQRIASDAANQNLGRDQLNALIEHRAAALGLDQKKLAETVRSNMATEGDRDADRQQQGDQFEQELAVRLANLELGRDELQAKTEQWAREFGLNEKKLAEAIRSNMATEGIQGTQADASMLRAEADIVTADATIQKVTEENFDREARRMFTTVAPVDQTDPDNLAGLAGEAPEPQFDVTKYQIARDLKREIIAGTIPMSLAGDAGDWVQSRPARTQQDANKLRRSIVRYVRTHQDVPSPEETRVFEKTGKFPHQHPRLTWNELVGQTMKLGADQVKAGLSLQDFRALLEQTEAKAKQNRFNMPSAPFDRWWEKNKDRLNRDLLEMSGGYPGYERPEGFLNEYGRDDVRPTVPELEEPRRKHHWGRQHREQLIEQHGVRRF